MAAEIFIDSVSVAVTPQEQPALSTRIGGWITNNAVPLVLALLALLVVLGAVAFRAVVRARVPSREQSGVQ